MCVCVCVCVCVRERERDGGKGRRERERPRGVPGTLTVTELPSKEDGLGYVRPSFCCVGGRATLRQPPARRSP